MADLFQHKKVVRILVADDDQKLCENIQKILQVDYYSVDAVGEGTEAKALIDYYEYDLLVLDWMMPGASGIEVCHYARSKGFDGGMLMLTAKDATENIIEGLDNGAGYGNVRGIDLSYWSKSEEIGVRSEKLGVLAPDGKKVFTFLFVGRLVGDKGINELVSAFAKLGVRSKELGIFLRVLRHLLLPLVL